jgi:hypothetical protein
MFMTKCGVQGHMKPRKYVQEWNTFSQMKENAKDWAQWLPSALSFWELQSCKTSKYSKPWLKKYKSAKLGPQDTIGKVWSVDA